MKVERTMGTDNILEAKLSEVTVEELFAYLGFTEDLENETRKYHIKACQEAAKLFENTENLRQLGPVPVEITNLAELDRLFDDFRMGFVNARAGKLVIVCAWVD